MCVFDCDIEILMMMMMMTTTTMTSICHEVALGIDGYLEISI